MKSLKKEDKKEGEINSVELKKTRVGSLKGKSLYLRWILRKRSGRKRGGEIVRPIGEEKGTARTIKK